MSGEFAEPLDERPISGAVRRRALADGRRIETQRLAVERQRMSRQGSRGEFEAVARQIQLVDHRLRHLVQQMGAGRDAEARREIAGDRRPTDPVGRLQDQHPAPARAR